MITNFLFKGKYATYAQFLSKDMTNQDDVNAFKIFNRYIDTYLCSAIFGILNDRVEKYDLEEASEEEKNLSATIRGEMFTKEDAKLSFILKLMILNSKRIDIPLDEKIDLAFRSNFEDEKNKHVIDLLNDYVLGGLSYLYDTFKDVRTGEEVSKAMYDLTKKYKEDMEPYLKTEENNDN